MKKYTFQCDKLTRDKEPERLKEMGIEVETRILSSDEMVSYLKKKLHEEVLEAVEAPNQQDIVNELIDIIDAVHTLRHTLGMTEEEFHHLAQEKKKLKGEYTKGVCLCTVTLSEDHPRYMHYKSHPEKYPVKEV